MIEQDGGEIRKNILRQISFYGQGVVEQLKDYKLTTIRKPSEKYIGFRVGEEIIGRCEEEVVPLVVWGVLEDVPLDQLDPVLLACDGFLNLEQAVRGLRPYPGYENTQENTPMTLIATMAKDKFDNLSIEGKTALLAQKEGKTLSEVVRHPSLAPLFRKSIAEWFNIRYSMFLEEQGLSSK